MYELTNININNKGTNQFWRIYVISLYFGDKRTNRDTD